MITWGIGTPSNLAILTLVGLAAAPEFRDAEAILVIGVYDGEVALRGTYDEALLIVGEV